MRKLVVSLLKKWLYSFKAKQNKWDAGKGGLTKDLTRIQDLFLRWNSQRLSISLDDCKKRYAKSWESITRGHKGNEYREYCVLSHSLFQVFYDDNPTEIFNSYQMHAPMHFLRMLSYPEAEWDDENPIVNRLCNLSSVRILDFGCGLAPQSRTLAEFLKRKGISTHLVLADIPTIRKDFLLWALNQLEIQHTFLDCTLVSPIPELPSCDICFATEFFEHVYNPLDYFNKMHEALNPHGLLITNIGDHTVEYMHVTPKLESLRNRIQELGYEEIKQNSFFCKPER